MPVVPPGSRFHANATDTGGLADTDEVVVVVVSVVEGYIYYFPIMFKNGTVP